MTNYDQPEQTPIRRQFELELITNGVIDTDDFNGDELLIALDLLVQRAKESSIENLTLKLAENILEVAQKIKDLRGELN